MKNFKFLTLALFLSTTLFVSCADDDDSEDIDCATFEWSYEGDSDPDFWSVCNADCGGDSQSPINITGAEVDGTLTSLNYSYEAVPIDLTNNGHTIEFEYAAGSSITVDGVNYPLLQFHFHTGSEHTVGGNRFPMECHLVHKNESSGDIAVVSVLFEEGSENAFLANFSSDLPASKDAEYTDAATVNIEDLLPTDGAYYTYQGSLTTPPCSEVVTWLVMRTAAQASSAQIDNFHNILGDNYRPAQPLNGRSIGEFN